jgi:glutamate--cysteine ligase
MSAIITQLDAILQKRRPEIEDWMHAQRTIKNPFFYNSVDLRHSGMKLVPVDTNLFPAGFNNLSAAARHRTVKLMQGRFSEMHPEPERILIVPENHTRNLSYLENLAVLAELIEQTGKEVRIGSLLATEITTMATMTGREVQQFPLTRSGNSLETTDGFKPDMIVLNNDCTSGVPPILEHLSQPIEPSYAYGWYNRRKSEHFRAYDALVHDFGREFDLDPWLITTGFHRCGVVNFHESKGIECVMLGVEKVLHHTRSKYAEYGITETPYVFVKADSGTYGMGIMTVRSGEELLELNKKARNKMNVIKEGTQNTEVIIQEGVPTIDEVENLPAEPMIYVIDGIPVGGAYRINSERDAFSNLNASGMRFAGMCDEGECGDDAKDKVKIPGCNFGVLGLVAALASLAAAREVYGGLDIGFSI